jgi:sporulation protein YlmC with PRC-barrel domain
MFDLDEDCIGKEVRTREGIAIGKISDLSINKETGLLDTIKVKTTLKSDLPDDYINKKEEIVFPSSSFILVKDLVILDHMTQVQESMIDNE